MTSISESSYPLLMRLPAMGKINLSLWTASVKPGYYGKVWGSVLTVSTNHHGTLARQHAEGIILAIDAGGFDPSSAAALGLIDAKNLDGWLALLPSGQGLTAVRMPLHVSNALRVKEGDSLHGMTVQILPNSARTNSMSLTRCAAVLRMTAGQALIFALPLAIFGWQTLLAGIGMLLLAAVLLALLWSWLPGKGWLKGSLIGSVIGAGVALTAVNFTGMSIEPALWLAITAGLCTFWIGIVLMGTKPLK